MTTLKRLITAPLVALAITCVGCSSLQKDLDERRKSPVEAEKAQTVCLGVVVEKVVIDYSLGIEVVRVLKESPAAEAGIMPGDEIRAVNGEPTRSAQDLERVLQNIRTPRRVEVVIGQRGAERTMSVSLTTWGEHDRSADAALAVDVLNNKSSFTFPLVVSYEKQWVSAERYGAYHGLKPAGPVVMYSDFELLPIISHFLSVFEWERVPTRGAWRLFAVFWPLRFTSVAEEDNRLIELAPGEEKLSVH